MLAGWKKQKKKKHHKVRKRKTIHNNFSTQDQKGYDQYNQKSLNSNLTFY